MSWRSEFDFLIMIIISAYAQTITMPIDSNIRLGTAPPASDEPET